MFNENPELGESLNGVETMRSRLHEVLIGDSELNHAVRQMEEAAERPVHPATNNIVRLEVPRPQTDVNYPQAG